jgi:hypothetical protein
MGGDNKYVCLMCGVDYSDREPRKRQGAFNLHKRNCILKHYQQSQKIEEPELVGAAAPCNHSWRLLNNNIMIEKRAVQKGFAEVCQGCQEVR